MLALIYLTNPVTIFLVEPNATAWLHLASYASYLESFVYPIICLSLFSSLFDILGITAHYHYQEMKFLRDSLVRIVRAINK